MGKWVAVAKYGGSGGDLPAPPGDITITGPPTVSYVNDGQTVQIDVPYAPPSPLNGFDRIHVYIQKGSGPIEYLVMYPYRSGDAHFSIWQPTPKKNEAWRIYGVAGTELQERPFHKHDETNPTPNVLVNVTPFGGGSTPGFEYFPLLTGCDGWFEYALSDSGARIYRICAEWDEPAYPALGALIELHWDGAPEPSVLGAQAQHQNPYYSDWMVMGENAQNQDVDFVFRTWGDPNDTRNSFEPGVTPTVSLTFEHPNAAPVIKNNQKITLLQIEPSAIGTTLSAAGGVLNVGNGAIDLAKFAAGVEPVMPVAATPLTKLTEIIYNTSTRQILRWNGTAYTRSMSGADIKAELFLDKLTAGEISAAAVTAVAIASGAVTSDKMATNWLDVGGGGSKPGQLRIFNASGGQIGFIGVSGSDEGGHFRTLGVGGSMFSNAPFRSDASGNLTISGGTIAMTVGSQSTVTISATSGGVRCVAPINLFPAVNGETVLNGAGLTLSAGFSAKVQIGATYVSGSTGGYVSISGVSSTTIQLTGLTGSVTAQSFIAGSTPVINSSGQWTGAAIPLTSGGTGGTSAATARANLQAMHWYGHYNADPGAAMPNDSLATWWTGSVFYLVIKNSGNKFRVAMTTY